MKSNKLLLERPAQGILQDPLKCALCAAQQPAPENVGARSLHAAISALQLIACGGPTLRLSFSCSATAVSHRNLQKSSPSAFVGLRVPWTHPFNNKTAH